MQPILPSLLMNPNNSKSATSAAPAAVLVELRQLIDRRRCSVLDETCSTNVGTLVTTMQLNSKQNEKQRPIRFLTVVRGKRREARGRLPVHCLQVRHGEGGVCAWELLLRVQSPACNRQSVLSDRCIAMATPLLLPHSVTKKPCRLSNGTAPALSLWRKISTTCFLSGYTYTGDWVRKITCQVKHDRDKHTLECPGQDMPVRLSL